MIQVFASATVEEAIDKLMPLIMPIITVIGIAIGVGIALFMLDFINGIRRSNAEEREKERRYKYTSASSTSTKSRLESALLRKIRRTKMTNKNIVNKCMTFIMYTSFSIALVTMSVSFMGQAEINYSSHVIRPLLQILYDNKVIVLIASAFMCLIAININLHITIQQINAQEQHEKKHILENQQNTKSRLELTKLQERGY